MEGLRNEVDADLKVTVTLCGAGSGNGAQWQRRELARARAAETLWNLSCRRSTSATPRRLPRVVTVEF